MASFGSKLLHNENFHKVSYNIFTSNWGIYNIAIKSHLLCLWLIFIFRVRTGRITSTTAGSTIARSSTGGTIARNSTGSTIACCSIGRTVAGCTEVRNFILKVLHHGILLVNVTLLTYREELQNRAIKIFRIGDPLQLTLSICHYVCLYVYLCMS